MIQRYKQRCAKRKYKKRNDERKIQWEKKGSKKK